MSDALSTLRAAVAPKGGMQRIALPVESYVHPSPPLNQKLLINFYAEVEPTDSRTAAALIATGGLAPFPADLSPVVLGGGPVTAINADMPGIIYAVSGTHFYRINQTVLFGPYVATDLGDVGTPGGNDYPWNLTPTIATGVTGVVVCVPPNAFTATHTGALNQITDPDYPGARSVAYLDGYYVFTSDDLDSQFFSSLLADPTAFNALDFAFADSTPNIIHKVMALRGDLWFLGDSGIEIWYDAGQADFPFRRQPGGIIPHGPDSVRTCAIGDGSMFWVSGGVAYRSVGYKAARISTHAIEDVIRPFGPPGAVCSFCYTQNGHTFYAVTYENTTLCYDVATEKWHNRASSAGGPWLPVSACPYGGGNLFGSGSNGKLLGLEPGLNTDDGVVQGRLITLPPLWAGTKRAFCSRLEVELEIGGPLNPREVLLEWSDDGGWTWTGSRVLTADRTGLYRKRVFTTRLGSFRQRSFRLTMDGHATIYAVDADIVPGAH